MFLLYAGNMDRIARSEIELEKQGLVSADVRDFVIERDGQCCRVCGRYVENPALHHIVFRSQGGLDIPSNLITIGWTPWHDCHLPIAHGPDARRWRQLFLQVTETPGVTALQMARWQETARPPQV